MDFIRYAEASASLVNTSLDSRDALVEHLTGRAWLQPQCTDRDVATLRRFQRELRSVFEASGELEAGAVITGLNALMEKYPITPMISDHDDHLHLHVATRSASVRNARIWSHGPWYASASSRITASPSSADSPLRSWAGSTT